MNKKILCSSLFTLMSTQLYAVEVQTPSATQAPIAVTAPVTVPSTPIVPAVTNPTLVAPTETTPTQVSPAIMNPAQVAPTQTTPTQATPAVTNPTQVAPTETTPTQVSPAITNPTQVAPTVTNPTQVSPAITNPTQVAPTVTNPTQVAPTVTNPTQVAPTVTNPTQVAPTHVAPTATTPTQVAPAAEPMINCEYKIPAETKNVDQNLVLKWSENAVIQAFSLNSTTLDTQMQKLEPCFTEQGWKGFNMALKKSGNLDTIKSEHLSSSTKIDGAVSMKAIKENQWRFVLPVLVIYQNDKDTINQPLNVDLIVVRKVNGDLGITQLLAAPRTTDNTQQTATSPSNTEKPLR